MKHTYLYINIECSWSHKANLDNIIYNFVLSCNSLSDLTANYPVFAGKTYIRTPKHTPYSYCSVESTLLESPVRLNTLPLILKAISDCTEIRDKTIGLCQEIGDVNMKEITPDFSKVLLTYNTLHKNNPYHVHHLCFLSYFYRKDKNEVEDCLCAIAKYGEFSRQPKVNLSKIFDPYTIAENS